MQDFSLCSMDDTRAPISFITSTCGSRTGLSDFPRRLIPDSLFATAQTLPDCPRNEGRLTPQTFVTSGWITHHFADLEHWPQIKPKKALSMAF